MWPQVSQYPHIKTLDIESERPEVLRVPVPKIEEEFGEVAFTRDELIDKLLSTLEKNQVDIVRKIFNVYFNLYFKLRIEEVGLCLIFLQHLVKEKRRGLGR
jgi:hypothetical protein